MTQLHTKDVQVALRNLGYYDGEIDGDYFGDNYRADLKTFQRDYHVPADGIYGPKTEAVLAPIYTKYQDGIGAVESLPLRRWFKSSYWIAEVTPGPIPIATPEGMVLAKVSASSFVAASLEGTARLKNGLLVNVTTPRYRRVNSKLFQPVYDIAKRNKWLPDKPGYAGLRLTEDGRKVAMARNFEAIRPGPKGWPISNKIEMDPFRTVAADIGRVARSDPRFKRGEGLVPIGTRVYILELDGMTLPDRSVHDGWVTVNDCGGAIFGAHFDLFTGTRRWREALKIPGRIHIWFEGIEDRVPMDYSYGLK